MNFKDMHYQKKPLIVCNVWDAASAQAAEKAGFQVIGTSSGAISGSMGYEDGEVIRLSEMIRIVKNIALATNQSLAEIGVAGINLEDSRGSASRTLLNADAYAENIKEVRKHLNSTSIEIFINARIDTYIMGVSDALFETKRRIKLYEQAGVDGVFVPFVQSTDDIAALAETTNLPLNVLPLPQFPDFDDLSKLGVRRISMADFPFKHITRVMESAFSEIASSRSCSSLF